MRLKSKKFLAFVACYGILAFLSSCYSSAEHTDHQKDSLMADSAVVVHREFGLPVDSFKTIQATIQHNQFLSNILSPHGISPLVLAKLAKKSKSVFDIRSLRAGKPYTLLCSKDSSQHACYFVYQPNPIDYVVYDLNDSIRIYKGKLPVTTTEKESSGLIRHSLFQALDEAQADPDLAIKMAEIYAWDVDFYHIQKGDWFKLIYDQQYVKGKPVGLGRIKSAVFNHAGQKFYAFYFKDDSTQTEGYFDEKSHSLRKAFLKAPMKYFHITSHYTMHRFHPIQHRWKAHLGTDFAAPTGTPIMSTAAGVVIASRYTRFNGNYVKVRHNSVYTTQYLHMSKRAVKKGQHVKQGQIIGYVGSTGLATGPHVCYRFWKNGKQVNPLKLHFPPAQPIKERDSASYVRMVQFQRNALDKVPLDTASEEAI